MSLKNVLAVALGILSAIGGFVDIGDLVFNTQAGATFGYQLLWVVVVGVVGIIVYSEMCGRVAAVAKRPVFDLVRERAGFGAGLATLIASGGRQPDDLRGRDRRRRDLPPAALGPAVPAADPARRRRAWSSSRWALPFEWIERVFGYLGPLPARLRRRRDQAAPGLGEGRPRLRARHARRRQPARSTSTSSSACSARR